MSEMTTHQKTKKHSEETEPVVLTDKELGDVAGGAHSQGEPNEGTGFSPDPATRRSKLGIFHPESLDNIPVS